MLHVQPKSGDDSFGDFWRKERKTHSNDLGLTSDSHIEGALYERPRCISCERILLNLTREAARLKSRGGIAYADCFAAAVARLRNSELITGDPEFKRVEDVVKIRWI